MRKLLLIVLLSWNAWAMAQVNLDQTLPHTVKSGSTAKALESLERSCQCRFSYIPDLLPDSVPADTWTQLTFRQGLDRMLGPDFAYRQRGTYVVIRHLGEAQLESGQQEYAVTGYIRDAQTGQAIPFATVYDTASLRAALSGEDGYYELSVPDTSKRSIGVQLPNQKDTFIDVSPLKRAQLFVDQTVRREWVPPVQETIDTLRSRDFWNRQLDEIKGWVPDSLPDLKPVIHRHQTDSASLAASNETPVNPSVEPEANRDSSAAISPWSLGLSLNSYQPFHAAVHVGWPQFYGQILFTPSQGGNSFWAAGLGLGAHLGAKQPIGFALEASTQYGFTGLWTKPSLLGQASTLITFRLNQHLRLMTGPEFNAYFLNTKGVSPSSYQLPTYGWRFNFTKDDPWETWLYPSWRLTLVLN